MGNVTEVIEQTTSDLSTDNGDSERFAHYADKDKITESMVFGTPIRAICGKIWVPTRDPKRYPVCPACKELYESLPEVG